MEESTDVVEADPKRPYKMYAAIAAAMLTSVLGESSLPLWLRILFGAIVAGLGVYLTPNPLRYKKNADTLNKDADVPLFD